jgi:hypothetical protein
MEGRKEGSMLPVIPKPPITAGQKRVAVAVAMAVDLLQIALLPMLLPGLVLDDVLDVMVAMVLVAVCGFRWQFALAFGLELLPLVNIFPTWTALVLTLQAGPKGEVKTQAVQPVVGKGVVDVEGVLVPPVQRRELPKP